MAAAPPAALSPPRRCSSPTALQLSAVFLVPESWKSELINENRGSGGLLFIFLNKKFPFLCLLLLVLFKQKGIFDHFSPLVEAPKKNILEWHLSIWQFPGWHSWIMTLTRTARPQLPNIYSQREVAQESRCVSWSLPGPAGRVEKLPSYKLALCQGGFLGQEWIGSGLCQSGRRRANWLSSQIVVPSWQQWSGHSRSALAPPAWQLDFQLPQVKLSDCIIFFQGQREHIVSFFFPRFWFVRAPAQHLSLVPWCKHMHVPMATFSAGRTVKFLARGKSQMVRACQTRVQEGWEVPCKICTSEPSCLFACWDVWYCVLILNHLSVILLPIL